MSGVTEGSGSSVSASRWGKKRGECNGRGITRAGTGNQARKGRGAASLLLYPYSAHINFVDMYAKFVTDRRHWVRWGGKGRRGTEVRGGERRICFGETVLAAGAQVARCAAWIQDKGGPLRRFSGEGRT